MTVPYDERLGVHPHSEGFAYAAARIEQEQH